MLIGEAIKKTEKLIECKVIDENYLQLVLWALKKSNENELR